MGERITGRKVFATLADALNVKIYKQGDCWLWVGLVNNCGSPVVFHHGKTFPARRAMLQLHGRSIKYAGKALRAVNLCGSSLCVAPEHNAFVRPDKVPGAKLCTPASAIKSGRARRKLTESQITAIRLAESRDDVKRLAIESNISYDYAMLLNTGKRNPGMNHWNQLRS